jgi:hypothetical protein
MQWLVGGVLAAAMGVVGWIWYQARKTLRAETGEASERALRTEAEKRAAALEEQRRADHAAARAKDTSEGTKIIESGDASRAAEFLLRSIRGR